MEAPIVFVLCLIVTVNSQLLNPISSLGLGTGYNNPMWHSGVRYPGLMQTSQLNSMTYPTWRSHPIFKMVPEKSVSPNLPSDVINMAKVPSAQEVLTHMALANPNPKPYFDTISDFLYEPQKTRAVMSSVASGTSMTSLPVTSVGSVGPVHSMGSVPSSMYLQGMNLMKAVPNVGEDCIPQENPRWERGMDWLY